MKSRKEETLTYYNIVLIFLKFVCQKRKEEKLVQDPKLELHIYSNNDNFLRTFAKTDYTIGIYKIDKILYDEFIKIVFRGDILESMMYNHIRNNYWNPSMFEDINICYEILKSINIDGGIRTDEKLLHYLNLGNYSKPQEYYQILMNKNILHNIF